MSVVAAPPLSPYKGLAAFADSELDALFFFGRERERDVLTANLLASRLTVLYGESGVGKSSLLAAAVARELRAGAPSAPVVLHSTWSGGEGAPLDDVAGAAEGYLILDQFEEYFLYHGDEDGPGALIHELPELLYESRVNVLISIREDALARLDAFKARIPSVFGNQVRLEHLEPEQARSAIVGPLDRWRELTGENVDVEPALIQAILHETRTPERDRIEAPYLQLVLERIWQAERDMGSTALRLDTLRGLGGAATIVRDHLHVALDSLAPEEQSVAADMFEHLVTPSGTKIAHRLPDLAEYARVPESTLNRVLSSLTRNRIVQSVDGSDRYEIFHDVLAEPISAWRLQLRLEQERADARRRQRRLVMFVVGALVALAAVGALAVWALSERGAAQAQARHARARQLEALSLQQLPDDPNRGLRLALAAARLEPDRVAESVLRQSLVADRLRLAAHVLRRVRAVAVSPDGRLIAVARSGGTVLLLSSRNRRRLGTLRSSNLVSELAFGGPDRLIGGSAVGAPSEWDLRNRTSIPVRGRAARLPGGGLEVVALHGELRRVAGHLRRLVASADGQFLAAAVADSGGRVQAELFRRDGTVVRLLPRRGVLDLAFSPDGKLLATVSANSESTLWDGRSGRRVRTLRDSKHGANAVAFSPDGGLLATGGRDDAVRVWTVATGERTFFLFQHKRPVTALAWSPDGRILASAADDDTVLLWRVQDVVGVGSLAAILAGSTAPVNTLAFGPGGARLVTGGDDATVRVWDARADQQLAVVARAPGAAVAAQWAGHTIVAAWSSGAVETFSASTHRRLHILQRRSSSSVTALGVSPSGAVVAVGTAGGSTTAWDARTDRRLWSSRGDGKVRTVSVSPAGMLVAVGYDDGLVRVLRGGNGTQVWSATTKGAVRTVVFSAGGDHVLAASTTGLTLWAAPTGRLLRTFRTSAAATDAAFSPDGKLVAAAGADGDLRLWHSLTGDLYRRLRAGTKPLTDVVFSADSTRVATSGSDADGHIWSVEHGVGHVLQRAVSGPLAGISFDPTAHWVVGAGPVSAVIWNADDGRLLAYLRGHTGILTGASFAPASPTVLTSSRDGTVRTYLCEVCVDLPNLVHVTERRLAQTR